MVRLPVEYQEVEYLESTGTQWIDTGITINNGCVISIDFRIANTTANRVIWGYRRDKTYTYPYQAFLGANNKKLKYIAVGVRSDNGPDVFDYDVRNSVVIDSVNKTIKVNCEIKDCNEDFDNGKAFNIDGSSEYHPYLFALNSIGSTLAIASDTFIYSYSVSYNNKFSQNFIPCYRKSDNEIGMYDTVTGTFFTNQGTGTFLKGNDVNYDTVNLMESRRRILLNTPHLESLSGSTLSFKTDMASKLKECKIHFTPIQEGTGNPSPDNVRPIHGWDGVTVTRCGKNIYSGEQLAKLLIPNATIKTDSNGTYIDWRNYRMTEVYFPDGVFKENTRYTFLLKLVSSSGSVAFVVSYTDGSTATISSTTILSVVRFTTASNKTVRGIKIMQRTATVQFYFEDSGVFEGSVTVDEYEPYTAQSLTIPFPQTIYGGYVDLVKGEVVEEWKCYDMGDLDWGADTTEHLFAYTFEVMPVNENNALMTTYCEGYYPTHNSSLGTIRRIIGNYAFMGRSSYKSLYFRDDSYTTGAEFKQGNAGNHIIVPLATPTTYPLDPVTIRTLRGQNNIWPDANGNIELKFWTH